MTVRLVLSTPWARTAFPPDLRPAVEALIPEGCILAVGAATKPGEWTLTLTREPSPEDVANRRHGAELHRATVYGRDLPWLCEQMLRRWARVAA